MGGGGGMIDQLSQAIRVFHADNTHTHRCKLTPLPFEDSDWPGTVDQSSSVNL